MNVTLHKTQTVPDIMVESAYDFEAFLPLGLVRQHTKTEDIPAVTDEVLDLYREAAIQAAEVYTGLSLSKRKVVTEFVSLSVGAQRPRMYGQQWKPTFSHITEYPVSDDFVWYYGHRVDAAPEKVFVRPGSTEIQLPRRHDSFGLGCCNPYGPEPHAKIMYHAGYSCLTQLPAALKLGALKYIAHAVTNAGDTVVATTAAGGKSSSGTAQDVAGASDPAVASGAVAIWRTLVKDVF